MTLKRRPALPGVSRLRKRLGEASDAFVVTSTDFAKTTASLLVPAGMRRARFTLIAAGQGGGSYDAGGATFYTRGPGGNLRQQISSVVPGEMLSVVVGVGGNYNYDPPTVKETSVSRGGSYLARALNRGDDGGGGEVGTIARRGGLGFGSYSGYSNGGGAAGLDGDGGDAGYMMPGARGAGPGWTQTSNGETAINSGGDASSGYGGGGDNGRPGILIIEWSAT